MLSSSKATGLLFHPQPSFIKIEIDYRKDDIEKMKGILKFSDFSGFWEKNGMPSIEKIHLEIEKGKFYGITGPIGSDKSTLYQAIL